MTAAFLRVNGYRLYFNDLDAYHFLIDLYERNQFRFEILDSWLREKSQQVPENV